MEKKQYKNSELDKRIDIVYKSLVMIDKLNGSFVLKQAINKYMFEQYNG